MRFDELFRSYTRAHGRYVMGAKDSATGKVERDKGTGTVQGAPTPKEWEGHLNGKGPGLGLLPLLDDNTSVYWGAIDIDKYPFDHKALEADAENLPLVITKSKSGGAHCWLFMEEPTPAKLVVAKLNEWAAALGHGGVEIFPKQTSRLTENDVGNWINLPYFGETRQCFFQGVEVGLEKFLEVAATRRISKAMLEKIRIIEESAGAFFDDGPPCLQMITAMGGAPDGTRNNFMFAVGVYLKLKYPDSWADEMRSFNRTICSPPLSDPEIATLVGSLAKKKYNYHCSKAPLVSHCNRSLCVKRQYGVAQEGNDELNLNLSGLTKITTRPPRWLINIDGTRVEIESTNDLSEQLRFKRIAIETVHKIPTPLTNKKWNEVIQGLLNTLEIIEAPPEASPQGQFIDHLVRFVEVHGQTDSRDLMLSGRVFLDDGYAYFRPNDLFNYLKKERFNDLKTSAMYTILKELGVERDRFNSKGSTVSFWRCKTATLNNMQSEDFDAPKFANPFGEEAQTN